MTMTDRQKKIWGIAAIIALVVFTGLLCWFVGRPMIRFVSEPDEFREWVDSHGIWGRVAFIGMVIFQIIVAIIPGEPLEIGAGYAFGALEGTILCTGGDTLLALMKQVGVSQLVPVGELAPGAVLTRFRYREKEYNIIAKSGGFGAPDLFIKIANQSALEE